MNLNFIIFLLICATKLSNQQTESIRKTKRIFDGKPADWKSFNFVVAVLIDINFAWRHHCTGSLLAPAKVLSAAHCFFEKEHKAMILFDSEKIKIVGGQKHFSLTDSIFIKDVETIIPHERYKNGEQFYDIAIVLLKNDIPVDGVNIGIARIRRSPLVGISVCFGAGWGLRAESHLPMELRTERFVIAGEEYCRTVLQLQSPFLMCGFTKQGNSICAGDSGGPLICDNLLSGISDSSFPNCSDSPSIFTNTFMFVDWIDGGFLQKVERRSSAVCIFLNVPTISLAIIFIR